LKPVTKVVPEARGQQRGLCRFSNAPLGLYIDYQFKDIVRKQSLCTCPLENFVPVSLLPGPHPVHSVFLMRRSWTAALLSLGSLASSSLIPPTTASLSLLPPSQTSPSVGSSSNNFTMATSRPFRPMLCERDSGPTSVVSTNEKSFHPVETQSTATISVNNVIPSATDTIQSFREHSLECYNCPTGTSLCRHVTWDHSKGRVKDELLETAGVPHVPDCQVLYDMQLLPWHENEQLSEQDSKKVDAYADYLTHKGYATRGDNWVLGGKPGGKHDASLQIGLGVGIALLCLCGLVTGCCIACRRRRRQQGDRNAQGTGPDQNDDVELRPGGGVG
jgi:hypothetical protein